MKLRVTYFVKARETINISDEEAKKLEAMAANYDASNTIEDYINSNYKAFTGAMLETSRGIRRGDVDTLVYSDLVYESKPEASTIFEQ